MTFIPWQATVQDDGGNAVPSPVVTVRNAADDTLATIYDMTGVATSNPITGGADGFVQFQVLRGRYKIEGAKDGSVASTWQWEAQAADNWDISFASRSELVAWWASYGADAPIGARFSDGTVEYIKDGGSTISDLSGVSPFGVFSHPEHYAENTSPGVTNMSAAAQSAANNGSCRLLSTSYMFSDEVVVSGDAPYFRGVSSGKTSIVTDRATGDIIRFTHTDSIDSANIGGFSIEYTGSGDKTSGYYITSDKRFLNSIISDIEMREFYDGMRLYASGRCYVYDIWATISNARTAKASHAFVLDADALNVGKPTDLHLHNLQVFNLRTGAGASASAYVSSLHIKGADGVYVNNSHFHGGDYCYRYEPANSSNRDTCASVLSSNVYCDKTFISHVAFFGAAPVAYRDFKYTGCQFRDAQGSNGSILFSPSSGSVSEIVITGCLIRDNTGSGVITTVADGATQATISGNMFDNNNTANSATSGDVRLHGDGHTVVSNTFIGGGASGTATRLFDENGVIVSNNYTDSTAGTKVTRGVSNVLGPNAGAALKNKGSATINNPSTSVTVTHGVGLTPSLDDIIVTLSNNASGVTRYYIENVTATTFDISVNATPTTSATFVWQVDVTDI